jgi:hypothetical protein
MPLCICNTKLCLADSAETVKNYYSAGAITPECLIDVYELCLSCYEVFDIEIRKAKRD